MYGCRKMLPTLKKQVYILLCLGSLTVALTAFFNSDGISVFAKTPVANSTQKRFYEAALPKDQHQEQGVGSEMPRVIMTNLQPEQTKNSSYNESMCALQNRYTNYSSCPLCFRPGVVYVGNRIKEIGHKDYLIPDNRPGFFTPQPEIVQNVITEYLIVPQMECPYLLVIQPSILNRRNERDTVRYTWGSVAGTNAWPNRTINASVKVVFVVARQTPEDTNTGVNLQQNETRENALLLNQIQSEADQHKDILYLDMMDGYRNLTLKLLSAFKWVKDNCPCVRFVLKVDYDTFVNVPLLVDTLLYSENRLEFSILGMVYISNNMVAREGRWGVNETLYPMQRYPEYASGCGYVLSINALSRIVDTIPHFRMFPIEDAFITGVMRRVTGFRLFSLDRVFTHYSDKAWYHCDIFADKKILGLTVKPEQHQRIWDTFVQGSCS